MLFLAHLFLKYFDEFKLSSSFHFETLELGDRIVEVKHDILLLQQSTLPVRLRQTQFKMTQIHKRTSSGEAGRTMALYGPSNSK